MACLFTYENIHRPRKTWHLIFENGLIIAGRTTIGAEKECYDKASKDCQGSCQTNPGCFGCDGRESKGTRKNGWRLIAGMDKPSDFRSKKERWSIMLGKARKGTDCDCIAVQARNPNRERNTFLAPRKQYLWSCPTLGTEVDRLNVRDPLRVSPTQPRGGTEVVWARRCRLIF